MADVYDTQAMTDQANRQKAASGQSTTATTMAPNPGNVAAFDRNDPGLRGDATDSNYVLGPGGLGNPPLPWDPNSGPPGWHGPMLPDIQYTDPTTRWPRTDQNGYSGFGGNGSPRSRGLVESVYSANAAYSEFIGKNENYIIGIQRQMEAAGYEIGTLGVWGYEEIRAMGQLMGTGNLNGMTWQEVLAMGVQQGDALRALGGDGDGGLPPVQHVPEWALQTLLEDAGTMYLGRNFTDEEKQQFIGAFRDLENSRNSPGTDVAVKAFAERTDPAGYAANKASDVYGTMLSVLTGGAV